MVWLENLSVVSAEQSETPCATWSPGESRPTDDPFFSAVRATIRDRFVGSATELLEHLDRNGELGRTWRAQWPSPKAVSSRLKRHEAALRQAGWIAACSDNGHKGRTWELVAPVKCD
jgi:hypothetical protein